MALIALDPQVVLSPGTLMMTMTGLWSTILEYFFLKGTIMKCKFILFSPWLLKCPDDDSRGGSGGSSRRRSKGRRMRGGVAVILES